MKKLFTAIPFLFFVSFLSAQSNDLKTLELKGKVKSLSIKETHRYMKDGAFTPWANSFSYLYTFNPSGNKTDYSMFGSDGILSYKTKTEYNIRENTIQENFFDKDDKLTGMNTYELDDKGHKTVERQLTPKATLRYRYIYSYDDKGHLVQRTGYKADGDVLSQTNWKYDDKGNMMESRNTYFYNRYTYDDKGRRIGQVDYKPDGVTISLKWEYKYDDKGNKIEELKYKDTGELSDKNTWTLEYDKNGNWIKRTQYGQSGEPFHIEERTIVYY
jgi:hypothetical protein